MNILFVHDAFPGQFANLYRHLMAEGKHTVMVASRRGSVTKLACRQFVYDVFSEDQSKNWNLGSDSHAYELGLGLVKQVAGMAGTEQEPDVILSHASTGASFYLKDIFPKARFVSFCEWYYQQPKLKLGGEIKLNHFINSAHSTSMQNLAIQREFELADAAYAPTLFQKRQFPRPYHDHISQIHDGIDTDVYCPDEHAVFEFGGRTYSAADEIITYAARGMEHLRGFPQFMQSIAKLQKERPKTQVVIAAADRICYGNKKDPGLKQWALDTVDFDPDRTHFVGLLPEQEFVKMLQISSLHVYLTAPFVLSWSMLNAMSVGVPVLASATEPVEEVIRDGENGYLVPFDNVGAISARMAALLAAKDGASQVAMAGRETILSEYQQQNCLKQQLALLTLS
ncbi:MAG: hypothetical protein COB37_06310 [Kordiimonadales bacterium]|nr:MAG: hypothetical protein COB37_06310 [Kordiimonadales bacterium]